MLFPTLPDAFTVPADESGETYLNEDFESEIKSFLAATIQLLGAMAPTDLTISSGSITPGRACHNVDTEGAAASDFLDKIAYTDMENGSFVLIWPKNISRVVTIRSMQGTGIGRIRLQSGTTFVMNTINRFILLQRRDTIWHEILRGGEVSSSYGRQLITSSMTFIAPAETLFVTAIGGGGQGGGGAGVNTGGAIVSGANGANGASTTFGSITALGGSGGFGASSQVGAKGGSHGGLNGGSAVGIIQGQGGQYATGILGTMPGRGGAGGAGGAGTSGSAGGGGGSGMPGQPSEIREIVSTTIGASIAVVIGTGGTGGGTGGVGTFSTGLAGADGFKGGVLVEWQS